MDPKLTPMQKFALDLVKKEKKVYTGTLAREWYASRNNGRFPPCASRDRFGLTSASYKALRSLVEKGLIEADSTDRFNHCFHLKNSK